VNARKVCVRMLPAMRQHYEAGLLKEAVAVAALAAPFCYPRLASVTAKSEVNVAVSRVVTECLVKPCARANDLHEENGHVEAEQA
jgi:hypothetical protein